MLIFSGRTFCQEAGRRSDRRGRRRWRRSGSFLQYGGWLWNRSFRYAVARAGCRASSGWRAFSNETYNKWLTSPAPRYSDGNGIIVDINTGNSTYGTTGAIGRTLVENNVCTNNGAAGINVTGASHVDVLNNTTYKNGVAPETDYGEFSIYGSSDVNLVNNLLVAGTITSSTKHNKIFATSSGSPSSFRQSNNSCWGGSGPSDVAILSGNYNGDATVAATLFSDPSNYDFTLVSNATTTAYVINKGTLSLAAATGPTFAAVYAPGVDKNHNNRAAGNDIGAFEYV